MLKNVNLKQYDGTLYTKKAWDNAFFRCSNCGDIFERNDDEPQVFDGEEYCQDCFDELFAYCDICGEWFWQEDSFWDEHREICVCPDCLERYYVRCDDCGELVHEDDVYTDDSGTVICERCIDNYYRCVQCDRLIHENYAHFDDETGDAYCDGCWEGYNGVIHDYYYKPSPIFHGTNSKLYMGIELEVDRGGEDSYNAQKILDVLNNDDENVYIKHDGSLDRGFEIVSHPATLEYHLNETPWKEAMKKLLDMGYRSHDAETCGLHVHMSRKAFGRDENEQDLNILKLIYFFEINWKQMLKFSRRTESQVNHWAARYGIYKDDVTSENVINIIDNVKSESNYHRYHVVNLQNYHTIEVRMFRGTLKYTTFVATLQLLQYLYDTVMITDITELEHLNWNTFIKGIPENYTELKEYLKERGIDDNNNTADTIDDAAYLEAV